MASTTKVSFNTNSGIRMKALDKAKLAILLLLSIWVYSFKDNLLTILHSYNAQGYSAQGFVAIGGFLILYFSKYSTLTRTTIESSQLGLFLVLIISTCWVLANIAGNLTLEIISCLALLPMLFLTVFGWQATKKMYYALAFVFCALPISALIGDTIAKVFFNILVKLLSASSDQIFWQKNIIEFKNQTFDLSGIIETLQNIMLFITIALFVIYYLSESFFKRLLFASMILTLPLVLLICIQFIIIRFGFVNNYSNNSGFTYFIMGTSSLLVLILGILWKKDKRSQAFNRYNERNDWQHTTKNSTRWLKPTIVSCCIMLTLPFATNNIKDRVLNYQGEVLLELPAKIGNWYELSLQHNLDIFGNNPLTKNYQKDYPVTITMNANFFEKALASAPSNSNVISAEWNLIKTNLTSNKIFDKDIEIEEKIYSNGSSYKLIWSFYAIHQHIIAKHTYAIIADNWYTMLKRSRRSSYLSFSSNFTGNIEDAREQLHDFLINFWPELPKISNPPRKLN